MKQKPRVPEENMKLPGEAGANGELMSNEGSE
jgi:hypothetical protein